VAADQNADEQLSAQLQSPNHHLTKAILQAFERVDWNALEKEAGNLRMGLARLAAATAWMEQKRGELPNEAVRRHREAQHRSSLSLVESHREEWRELMRTHRAQIDIERDAEGFPIEPAHASDDDQNATPGPKTARHRGGWLERIKAATRRSTG
jgi:hypothetical protein